MAARTHKIGDAAEALGVGVETLRRWEREGKITMRRTAGGQRLVPSSELKRLLTARKRPEPRIVGQSARNRFDGVVTEVKKDGLVATVEIRAGQFRILALTTREAVEDLGLEPGMRAVAAVKATNVVVEVPA
ncbi:MAG: TOBE domain-containing protein [Actinomycetota bacterium]